MKLIIWSLRIGEVESAVYSTLRSAQRAAVVRIGLPLVWGHTGNTTYGWVSVADQSNKRDPVVTITAIDRPAEMRRSGRR